MNKKARSIPIHTIIGNRIRQIREKYRLSQTGFAKKIGVSQTFMSDLESGKVHPPEPLLLAIEYIYRFRREWVINGDEPWHIDELAPVIIPFVGIESSERQLKYWITKVVRIFENGDKDKIDALKAQLRALDPGEKKQDVGGTENAEAMPKSDTG